MSANQLQQTFGMGLFSAEAGNTVNLLHASMTFDRPLAMKQKDLLDPRPIKIVEPLAKPLGK
jgi:hypothetical protein